MVSTSEGFNDNIMMSYEPYMPVKNLMRGNQSVNFQKHWTSNLGLVSAGSVLLNKRARISYISLCCGPVYQNDVAIQTSTNVLKISLQKYSTTSSDFAVPNG